MIAAQLTQQTYDERGDSLLHDSCGTTAMQSQIADDKTVRTISDVLIERNKKAYEILSQ